LTKKALAARLIAERIPPVFYSLDGGHSPEKLCLRQTPSRWEVYYSERGNESDLTTFVSEQEACDYFYRRIKDALGL